MCNLQVMLHGLACRGHDICLLEEQDTRWFLDVGRTKDWRYLTLTSTSKTASEVKAIFQGHAIFAYSEKCI